MKFYISRTSDGNFNEKTPPLPGLEGETLNYIQKIYGGTEEPRTRTIWPIEIESLESLMNFVKKEGDIVISMNDGVYSFGPRIIIYDDYLG